MRPLSPAERAAILAEHPGTTEEDLDRFLSDLAARHAVEPERSEDTTARRTAPDDPFPRMADAVRRVREAEEGMV